MYDQAVAFLKKKQGNVHCLGVGGVGVAGLAYLLKKCGWRVSGCDSTDGALLDWLNREGVSVAVGHSPSHLEGMGAEDIVIRSAAVPMDDPEICEARRRGIPVFDRGVMFAAFMNLDNTSTAIDCNRLQSTAIEKLKTICVCGSHGKTTTATFIATLLKTKNNQLKTTSWCIGGTSSALGTLAYWEEGADCFVAECDESDGTLQF